LIDHLRKLSHRLVGGFFFGLAHMRQGVRIPRLSPIDGQYLRADELPMKVLGSSPEWGILRTQSQSNA
jgi:hypothetical protein